MHLFIEIQIKHKQLFTSYCLGAESTKELYFQGC